MNSNQFNQFNKSIESITEQFQVRNPEISKAYPSANDVCDNYVVTQQTQEQPQESLNGTYKRITQYY